MGVFPMFTHDQETESTVSTGKLLGLFLLLVVLCGVFFVLGYSFGRSTAAASLKPAPAPSSAPAAKPAASSSDYSDRYGNSAAATTPTTPYITSTPPPGAIPAPQAEPDPAPAPRKPVVPEPARTTAPLGSYLVQVAAVSKKQDADALSNALRRKQYQVFINQTEANGLYRIQIGPFGDRKDAEVVRLLLVSDGYTPIIIK